MNLEILSPEQVLFSSEVYGVQLPGTSGLFELLDKHAPLVASLGKGTIKVLIDKSNANTQRFSISGGFVEVLNNRATVLVEKAEALND